MPIIYGLIIFVLLVVTLSALRTRLVYELSGMSLLTFGSTKPGIMLYSLVFLPGTIIHELSHWVMAEILQVRTGEITIFPSFDDQGGARSSERLGSVSMVKSDPIRGFFIGLAPFITGLAILVVLGALFSTGWEAGYPWWQLGLMIYGIVVVGNSMMISESDRRSWPFILILTGIIVFFFVYFQASLPSTIYDLTFTILRPLNLIMGVTAGLNLVMIVGLYGLRLVVEKITKRRIL